MSFPKKYDINLDGKLNVGDLVNAHKSGSFTTEELLEMEALIMSEGVEGGWVRPPLPPTMEDDSTVGQRGISMPQVGQIDLGISTAAVGSREELGRMLESYKGKTSLIQGAQRQKAIYTIDRFDGGINQNKAPRDLSYWESVQMDELTPSKIGRLIRLGDFTSTDEYNMALAGDDEENFGLHYFKWSDSVNDDESFDGGAPTNYMAYPSGDGGIDAWNFTDASGAAKLDSIIAASTFINLHHPVYHSVANRLYVSDEKLSTTADKDKSIVCGIVDRRQLFPIVDTSNYCIANDSHLFKTQNLYHAAPVKGTGDTEINIVGTQANVNDANGGQYLNGITNANGQHGGIYININFETILGDEVSSTGWGASTNNGSTTTPGTGSKYYYFYASFLYDDGSETKLTPVSDETVGAGAGDTTAHTVVATTGTGGEYQKLVIKQVYIDGAGIVASNPRIHGARFYYSEADGDDGNLIGNDKYLWAELDFRYGFKLVSEFGHWNQFEDDSGATQAIQVKNAAESSGSAGEADGTLSILSPPTAFTYYALNLFHQEELKDDLMWKTSTMGNGIAFIGNLKYDSRTYPDTMLYSGAGETDSGSVYPMWGTFPVDSNRIDIPGIAGEILALKWIANRVLQFRTNALYVINVEDVLAPKVEGVYQGMGAQGNYAVTETPFGVAWVNNNGVYAYNAENKKARSLTIGRLDAEDFGADQNTKIGYDDRAKMLIIGNHTLNDTSGYHYAYSFVTDAWCTWNQNASSGVSLIDDYARPGAHDAWQASQTHTNVSQTSTDGSGLGILCDIVTDGSGHTAITIVNSGSGYVIDEEITFTDPGSTSNTAVIVVNALEGNIPRSNFAINPAGYLTGGIRNSIKSSGVFLDIYTWNVQSQTDATVDYITKDIDFGKPSLDKRLYTLYISYTGGANNAVKVYFRPNGKDGAFLGASSIWYELKTLQDYTNPYGSTDGDDNVSISTTTSLASTIEPSAINNQKLAKINLRSFATDTTNIALGGSAHGLPPDYFRWMRSIQLRFVGVASDTFEINDISLVYKEKRIK